MKPLSAQRVLVVGMGGLGCPASLALAQEGVGALTLMDADRVELSNLHRQPWHHTGDVGKLKVDSAKEKLGEAFPGVRVQSFAERIAEANVESLFAAHDWVVDGTDSVTSKFLLSDTAVRTGVPVVYAGVVRLQGQAMVVQPGGPCLRCLFESLPDEDELPTCAGAGVSGPLAGLVGLLQVRLALAELGRPGRGRARLVRVDGLKLESRTSTVLRSPECPRCSAGAFPGAAP